MRQVSDHIITGMGFQRNDDGIELCASFFSLHVYEFHGLSLPDGSLASVEGRIAGVEYATAIGLSVNDLCNVLSDDDFADDEETWKKAKNCSPPYLLVRLGPTSPHSAIPSHLVLIDDVLRTYEAFALAKAEIQGFEDKALPSILTASVVALSEQDRPQIRIRNVDKAVFGVTPEGKTLHDIRLTLNATLSVSSAITSNALVESFETIENLGGLVDSTAAKFFGLALGEQDPLKRFLYFFLSIEVHTHRTFSKIKHPEHLANLHFPDDRIQLTSASFFGEAVKNWTNLRDRFLWCANCVWTNLDQSDVMEFARLKRIRDGIAHGDLTSPIGSDVIAVEKLAIKIQKQLTMA